MSMGRGRGEDEWREGNRIQFLVNGETVNTGDLIRNSKGK